VNEWAVPTVAVLLLACAAVSARLRPSVVTQAMVFVSCGLLVGNRVLDLVDVDMANQYCSARTPRPRSRAPTA
jgi:hypothetical protein